MTLNILRRLLPNLERRLLAKGAVVRPRRGELAVKRLGGYVKVQPDDPHDILAVDREHFETELRKEVEVETLIGTATGIEIECNTVRSVAVRMQNGETRKIDCALLIDASGPARVTEKWLSKAGFPAPTVDRYDPRLRYSQFRVQLTETMQQRIDSESGYPDPAVQNVQPGGAIDENGSFLGAIQDGHGQWRYVVASRGDSGCAEEPKDWQHFVERFKHIDSRGDFHPSFAKATRIVIEEIDKAPERDLTNIGALYHVSHSPRTLAANLIPIGDCLSKLNPIAGTGIVKACIDAVTLDRVLRAQQRSVVPDFLVKDYLTLHAARTDSAYEETKSGDSALPTTILPEGEKRATKPTLFQRYMKMLWLASIKDESGYCGTQLLAAVGLVGSPLDLYSPRLALRALYYNLLY